MIVMAIDPGIMTGYCYAELAHERMRYYPFQSTDQVDDVWRRFRELKPRFIIIEDFEFRRGKRSAGGLELFPVQIIGVTNLYGALADHQCAVFVQKAAQGKAYYSDAVLKNLGLHKRGIPHGMDASRHLLHWCMFGYGNQFIGPQQTEDFAEIQSRMNFWMGGG